MNNKEGVLKADKKISRLSGDLFTTSATGLQVKVMNSQ